MPAARLAVISPGLPNPLKAISTAFGAARHLADATCDFQAVAVRQSEVEDDHLRSLSLKRSNRRGHGLRSHAPMAIHPQDHQTITRIIVVLDHEYGQPPGKGSLAGVSLAIRDDRRRLRFGRTARESGDRLACLMPHRSASACRAAVRAQTPVASGSFRYPAH
ncbi:MAG: hypothetical protein R3E83_15440 [Burkholderiaceae bacterium]